MWIPRPAALGVGLSTIAALTLVGPGTSQAHAAAPPTSTNTVTSAEIVHLTALDLTALGEPDAPTLADAAVGATTGRVDGSRDLRTVAVASNLTAALADQATPALLATARQAAPPDHLRPDVTRTVDGQVPGLVSLGMSTATAQARWTGDGTCPAPSVPLTQSKVTTTDLATASVPGAGTLLNLRGTADARQATTLESTSTAGIRSVVATAQGSAANLRLLGGDLAVAVTDAPTLTATADGTDGGAHVTWNAPAVTVTAGGQQQTLPADGTPVDFTATDNPALHVQLSVGQLTDVTQAADGTHAAGTASVLHVTAALGDGAAAVTVLNTDLFPLTASTTSPAGGVDCGTGSEDPDNDGLTNDEETTGTASGGTPTDPNAADTDTDGLTDGQEVTGSANDQFGSAATDPTKADTDDDGLSDGQETSGSANDAYGNAATDPTKADTDSDGLSDAREVGAGTGDGLGTDPNVADTDGGTVNDGDEVAAGTDPLNPADDVVGPDPVNDPDNDGLTNDEEVQHGTDPVNPDTDGDGLSDGREVHQTKTGPTNPDTDGDGLSDGREVTKTHTKPRVKDTDDDGLGDGREVKSTHTNPRAKDTDHDGLTDGREVKHTHTKPLKRDTDRDGLTDGREVTRTHTNPLRKDTDRDGLGDGREINGPSARYAKCGTNPVRKDTDRDGLGDGREVRGPHTNPCDWDTDDGGISDGREVKAGSDPHDPQNGPADVRKHRSHRSHQSARASDRHTTG